MSDITQAALRGVRWNYIGVVTRSGSNFIIGIFLARLLGPKPFGELAAATFVVGIANLLADAGFTSALVQAPKLTDLQIRYVFTVQFLIAIAMTLGCAAISPLVALSFHDPAVRAVLIGISPLFVLQALGQTANALLRRDLKFRTLQIAQLVSYFLGYLVLGIPMAILGGGVWSLVAAQLVQASLYAVMLYWQVRHPIKPTLDSSGAVLMRFGAKVTASNIINYGISNADNFFVGTTFGSTALGFYNRAFSLANQPAETIVGTLQQVLFASCSRAEGRKDAIRRAYLACLSGVAFVTVPIFWGVAGSAASVVTVLYGTQWQPAAPLFEPLMIALSMHALMAMAGPILSSLNLVHREIQTQTISLVIAVAAFSVASRYSSLAMAWAVCGVYVARCIVVSYPVKAVLSIRWRDFLQAVAGPLLLGLTAFLSARALNSFAQHRGIGAGFTLSIVAAGTAGILVILVLLAGRRLIPSGLAGFIVTSTPSFAARLSWVLPQRTIMPHEAIEPTL
jgi:O-antigen/teichoic acid export membrane protein